MSKAAIFEIIYLASLISIIAASITTFYDIRKIPRKCPALPGITLLYHATRPSYVRADFLTPLITPSAPSPLASPCRGSGECKIIYIRRIITFYKAPPLLRYCTEESVRTYIRTTNFD